jgi:hypothetical protein
MSEEPVELTDAINEEESELDAWKRRAGEFLDRARESENNARELSTLLETSDSMRHEAVTHAAEADEVASALEKRLAEVEARKLALAVAHGDVAPEAYERRRQIAVEGVRSFVAATRLGFRQRLNSKATDRR